MSDPLMRPAGKTTRSVDDELRDVAPLFAPPPFQPSTQQLAHVAASKSFGSRQAEICRALDEHGPMAIFQVADRLGRVESAISGRFSQLVSAGLIEKTGERIAKPSTGSKCDVYRRTTRPTPILP